MLIKKKTYFFTFLVLATVVFGLTKCTKANLEDLEEEFPSEIPCEPLPEVVTYNEHLASIVESTCAISDCHVPLGDGTGDFSTGYDGVLVQAENGNLRSSQVIFKNMPPGGTPDCESELWEKWLDTGMLEE